MSPPENKNAKVIPKKQIKSLSETKNKQISPFSRDNIITDVNTISVDGRWMRTRSGVFARWNGNSLLNQNGKEFIIPENVSSWREQLLSLKQLVFLLSFSLFLLNSLL